MHSRLQQTLYPPEETPPRGRSPDGTGGAELAPAVAAWVPVAAEAVGALGELVRPGAEAADALPVPLEIAPIANSTIASTATNRQPVVMRRLPRSFLIVAPPWSSDLFVRDAGVAGTGPLPTR